MHIHSGLEHSFLANSHKSQNLCIKSQRKNIYIRNADARSKRINHVRLRHQEFKIDAQGQCKRELRKIATKTEYKQPFLICFKKKCTIFVSIIFPCQKQLRQSAQRVASSIIQVFKIRDPTVLWLFNILPTLKLAPHAIKFLNSTFKSIWEPVEEKKSMHNRTIYRVHYFSQPDNFFLKNAWSPHYFP